MLRPLLLLLFCALFISCSKQADLEPSAFSFNEEAALIDKNWPELFGAKLAQTVQKALDASIKLKIFAGKNQLAQKDLDLASQKDIGLNLKLDANSFINTQIDEYSIGHGYQAALLFNQKLDLFKQKKYAKEAVELNAKASEEDAKSFANNFKATVSKLYLRGFYLQESLRELQDMQANAQALLELERSKYQIGFVSMQELYKKEEVLNSANLALLSTQKALEETKAQMQAFLATKHEELMLPFSLFHEPKEPKTLPEISSKALINKSEVRASLFRLLAARNMKKSQASALFPSFNISSSLSSSGNSLQNFLSNPVFSLGAGMLHPLINRKPLKINLKKAEINEELALLSYEESLRAALNKASLALLAYENCKKLELNAQKALFVAKEFERMAKLSKEAGVIGEAEFLLSKLSSFKALIELNNAKAASLSALADFLASVAPDD